MSGGRAADQRGRVAGRVVDEAGHPIEEAQVFLVAGPSHPDIAAITGADGRFALGGLLPGRYRLQAGAAGYDSTTIEVVVTAGDRAEVEMVLSGSDRSGNGSGSPDLYVADEIPGDDECVKELGSRYVEDANSEDSAR